MVILAVNPQKLVLVTFCSVYLYLIVRRSHRALAVWIGILFLLILGVIGLDDAIGYINWNVIGIFAGTLVVAEMFIYSKVPVLLSDLLIERSKTVGVAALWVCAISGFMSAFLENVATVLIVAPIALEFSRRLKVSPVPFLIGLAISSNLQGTATLIGDPPSMILAGFEKMGFNDFFFFQGKPGIFFAVELGAISSFAVLYLFFRRFHQPVGKITVEKPESWVPTAILLSMIFALALSSRFDPEFRYLGGVVCLVSGFLGLVWQTVVDRRRGMELIRRYDWETTFFLAGIFVLVGALSEVGLINDLARKIGSITGPDPFLNYTLIVWFSVVVSAFIDNVPYITAMLPVMDILGNSLNISPYLLAYGLLIGSCLGGNITSIGASANIVSVGILRREGHPVSFWGFAKIGLPFTIAATSAGYLFLLLVWS